LERTEKASGSAGTPGFLSTHPNSADRYTRVKALAAQAKQNLGKTTLKVNRDSYLRSIEGLVYGNDPRQGYVASNVFYHPDLKFSLPVPSGWKTENTPAQFQMAEPSGKALLVFLAAPTGTPEAAAQTVAKQLGISAAQAQNTTINGFPAVAFEGDQAASSSSSSSTPARVRGYVIKDGNSNFALLGLAPTASFGTYAPQFDQVAQGYKRLTDASRLNKQAERISIRQAKSATTLRQALTANGVASARLEELAIVNGMELGDQLPAGTLFKVVK
jgi:predicted Zn-dependent protease